MQIGKLYTRLKNEINILWCFIIIIHENNQKLIMGKDMAYHVISA